MGTQWQPGVGDLEVAHSETPSIPGGVPHLGASAPRDGLRWPPLAPASSACPQLSCSVLTL